MFHLLYLKNNNRNILPMIDLQENIVNNYFRRSINSYTTLLILEDLCDIISRL